MDKQKLVPYVSLAVVVIAGASYLVFLAFTWRQMQADRSKAYAKVDAVLDKLPKEGHESGNAGPDN